MVSTSDTFLSSPGSPLTTPNHTDLFRTPPWMLPCMLKQNIPPPPLAIVPRLCPTWLLVVFNHSCTQPIILPCQPLCWVPVKGMWTGSTDLPPENYGLVADGEGLHFPYRLTQKGLEKWHHNKPMTALAVKVGASRQRPGQERGILGGEPAPDGGRCNAACGSQDKLQEGEAPESPHRKIHLLQQLPYSLECS